MVAVGNAFIGRRLTDLVDLDETDATVGGVLVATNVTGSGSGTTVTGWAVQEIEAGGGGTPDDGSVTNAKVSASAAISADKLADGVDSKIMTAGERIKLDGIAVGATANSSNATLLARANHTGTQSADTLTDGTTNKAYTAAEKTKLAGIATGATAYLDEHAVDAVAGALAAGTHTGISFDYDDPTGSISATVTDSGGGGDGGSAAALYRRGINMAGGEFAHEAATLPGTYGVDYAYDSLAAFESIAARGHDIIRLPFRWERIQPVLGAALDGAELARLQGVVDDIRTAGMQAVLDVHNYGRFINAADTELTLGDDLDSADLVDLWTRLSVAFKDDPGVYAYGLMNEPHDFDAVIGEFTGTTRYDWASGVQGWTGDGASVSNVGGQLRFVLSPPDTSFYQTRKDDVGADRNGPVTGNVLEATVTLGAATPGEWHAILQWQTSGFAWQTAPTTTYTRVDTGAVVSGLVAGVAVRVRAEFASNIPTTGRPFAIQIECDAPTAGSYTCDVDDFAHGTVSGGQTAAEVWESAAQDALDAIRANGDTTKIMVPGYGYSGAQGWTTNHPAPWIIDSADNFAYEAHYYFDGNNSGTYSSSYATENSAAIGNGHASLADRAVTELSVFTDWLSANDVRGYLGEFGWTNTADTALWNAVGEAVYDLLDTAQVDATYWAAGARWGADYNLSAYTGEDQDTVKAQAAVIEAHPSASVDTGIAELETRVAALEERTTGAHATPHVGPAFMVIDATTAAEMTTAAASGATHALVQVIWDQVQSTEGGAVDASDAIAQIEDAIEIGLKVCLRVSLQYPPTYVLSGAPKFKRADGSDPDGPEHTADQASGDNVRDWVWSATGRGYVADFLDRLFSQLDWEKIERVQLGGMVRGEVSYPDSDGSTTPYYWAYSAPAQTGTDLAPRMAACPVPDHVPSTGTTWTDDDEIFMTWYQQSLVNWMLWLIQQHRRWFDGPIWVMHPGAGLRRVSQTPTDDDQALNWRINSAKGLDWYAQIASYPDPNVWPYSTWIDGAHFWEAAPYSEVNDGNAAAWYHLLRVAKLYGRSGRIWGENTGGNDNTDMDAVFLTGAGAWGYEGVTWLNHDSLSSGGDDTYANWAARIAAFT